MVLVSCKPEEQPPIVSYVFSDVSVDAKQTSATITCRNESVDDDKVFASVLLSKNENITNATKYPLSLQNDTLHCTINGLERNTMYFFCFEVSTVNEHKRTDEVHHFETTGGGNVMVTTSEAINITQNGATGGGNVSADGNYEVSMRGVCWDTVTNPNALVSPHLVSGQGTGTFLVNITGLNSHTTYYMKAYAVCNDVVYYGNEVHLTTQSDQLPTVTTEEVSNITRTSVQANGNVTSDGGTEVTRRGVCWSTAHEPSVGDDHADNGTGTGFYTVDITDLTPNTTYYVRAYAENVSGLSYGEEVEFTTAEDISSPTVTTGAVEGTTAHGEVTNDGGAPVTERGICWGTEHSPSIEGNHATSGTGTGNFSVELTGLTPGTTYYVRAYAKNSVGTSYGNEVSLSTTANMPTVTTDEVSNITQTTAQCGGNVTDDGGATVTERGICWGTSHNPTTASSHAHSGTGMGGYAVNMTGLTANTTYYVRAYATNSEGTSYGNEVSFKTLSGGGNVPTGAINGLFTINANGDQVYFSQGNLQYQASTQTWRFAAYQYFVMGSANNNISQTYSGWIDLFGWGTSGYNHGAVCYQPWSTRNTPSYYYAYGRNNYSLYDQTGQADWGYNAISNGGNQTGQWRTLTGGSNGEWNYVFNRRRTTSGILFAKARVNNVNGVILLPDNWSASTYSLSNTNQANASFSSNIIAANQWNTLQNAGAVFLPAAGLRCETSAGSFGSYGYYWSASYRESSSDSPSAYDVYFNDGQLVSSWEWYYRSYGHSVRLVCPAGN